MRRRGRQARPADAAAVEVIDQASRAHPRLELASVRVGGPVATARAKHGIGHERLSEQVDQFLAIDGIHSADDKARTEEEQWRRSRTHSAGDGGLRLSRFQARGCVSGDRLLSLRPDQEMRTWRLLAVYCRDFDQESLAVPRTSAAGEQ
jgi:hypothetical protein